ncbi:MAG TPA: glycosyltransferase [Tepidisphaeraceae bacterium]|nr:glycosyltransferase [Tepidisphaeraceae bacterium]
MIVFLGILILVAVVWVWLLISPTFQLSLKYALNADTAFPSPGAGQCSWPTVTVVIPARNEADTLPTTIPTICGQDYPDLRVVLVDDQSDDGSSEVIAQLQSAHPNLTVVQGTSRPAGWHGKQWAVKQGVDRAKTDHDSLNLDGMECPSSRIESGCPQPGSDHYLLFTDADIIFHPQVVRQTILAMQARKLEMLSLLPQLILGSASERLALAGAMALISALFPLSRANNPKSRLALAAGGFILIRRDVYERVGGHASVKSEMIEDLGLARVLKSAGVRMQTLFTCDLLHTRMYNGLADLWEGLSKNAFAGLNYSLWKYFAGAIGGSIIGILPPVYLALSLVLTAQNPSSLTWAALALSLLINLCMIVVHSRVARHLRLPLWHSTLLPVTGVFYNLIVAWSVYQHYFTAGTVWKGRQYRNDSTASSNDLPTAPAAPARSDPAVATDRYPGR